MTRRQKWLLFAIVFGLVLLWVSTAGAGDEPVARSFLRNLLRAIF
jgi:hypothetical protein